ncbi:MAG: 6-phosphogluconolactonase [Acidobacteria bacterium]|nr:6-phosphogluconolactonase [Acidobacteriota bacterium]
MTAPTYTLDVSPDSTALTVHAAEEFVKQARVAIAERHRFSVALSGGSTPKVLFEMLASDRFRDQVDWSKVYFFWGDERSVPPDHKDSNFRMANDAMLKPLNIPESNIFRIQAEKGATEAAALYRQVLADFFTPDEFPRFDLLYLGMGDDGHTASLFPHTEALKEQSLAVVDNYVPKFQTTRITLTIPAINQARHIVFLASGAGKADMLVQVLEGEYQPETLPSQFIRAASGTLTWMVDAPAAEKLHQKNNENS